ncbi:SDR family oxidoreductase [Halomarina ordinaria]|uniref:SDR family oxidoreductase n=1 Tax=Halomarina ordinaria TaxID=3033939 RepID=A0ABD5UFT9_9EURY|nr:SDR family oxidoreductase [Halomarina sp. PSRA2]
MSDHALEDSAALVTGATSGIGRATALRLAAAGADVALAARREERLEAVAEDVRETHDRAAIVVPTDVRDRGQVTTAVDETVEAFGGLDVVVANAGLGVDADVEDLSVEEYELMTDVNVDGMFYTAQAAVPHLRESDGTLAFVGSFAGKHPRPDAPVYAATKWWTRGFALSLAGAVGDDGVAVTVVNPTEVRTEFGSESGDAFEERYGPDEASEPEDVADAVVFAAKQRPPNSVSELDLYRRDKFSHF